MSKLRLFLVALVGGVVLLLLALSLRMDSTAGAQPAQAHRPLPVLRATQAVTPTCHTYTSADVPKLIPDADPDGVLSMLNVPAFGYVHGLTLTLTISHTYPSDLSAALCNPKNCYTTLFSNTLTREGGQYTLQLADNAPTALEDGLPPYGEIYRPEQLMNYNNQRAGGLYKLLLIDNWAADTGTLQSWSLDVCTLTFREIVPPNCAEHMQAYYNGTPVAFDPENPQGCYIERSWGPGANPWSWNGGGSGSSEMIQICSDYPLFAVSWYGWTKGSKSAPDNAPTPNITPPADSVPSISAGGYNFPEGAGQGADTSYYSSHNGWCYGSAYPPNLSYWWQQEDKRQVDWSSSITSTNHFGCWSVDAGTGRGWGNNDCDVNVDGEYHMGIRVDWVEPPTPAPTPRCITSTTTLPSWWSW